MKKVSSKEASNISALKKVYAIIDRDRAHICTGCGSSQHLSHSHLISRKYKEFMADPDNIQFHCQSIGEKKGCHDKWESSGVRLELRDYIQNMEYIKRVKHEQFRLMIMHDYAYWMVPGIDINYFEKHRRNIEYMIKQQQLL